MKLTIHEPSQVVTANKKRVFLTPKEYRLLVHLKNAKGDLLSREELALRVWSNPDAAQSRTVDQHVARLRKKFPFPIIETRTLAGYRYIA